MRRAESKPADPARRPLWRRLIRAAWFAAYGLFVLLPLVLIAIYRYLPPPVTPLMLIRVVQGEGIEKDWVSLERIGQNAPRAVIAAEDNLYCTHDGFDWEALSQIIEESDEDGPSRGGSTISQQTAKNLFLWPGRSYVRKAIEAYLTAWLELSMDKRRILELYMNVVEWGPGIYGIEAAAQTSFKKPAAALSGREAARLAAILPNPRKLSASKPGPWTARQAERVRVRIGQLGELYDCVPEIAWGKQ